ncbi:hypothetical protein Ga0102493_112182 [Erythrobacter litoralis]|jgi:hypothetical protein|uniref:Lipoprotein n=1 Tax=Erythrobacter litoralis TaxID=39960 RepID=A0A074MIQ3_9SPHN|nr:hypothetical protein [Erythrobacter litoralis]AOL23199.1 hypothetical protein Ga0102493_112182 [Erythrobacter litoralis]KEO92655.1 hypothetical protein EH32_15470 [Erythrobacter litoralis]MEE4337137.1 hypothetical protein [Erythrobacter sp.]
MKNAVPAPAALASLAALALLSGCDVASEIAGDAIAGELRAQYIEQCQGVAESAGIAAERVNAACECSADDFAADLAEDGELRIDQGRIEQVLRTCVQEQPGTAPQDPAENNNG